MNGTRTLKYSTAQVRIPYSEWRKTGIRELRELHEGNLFFAQFAQFADKRVFLGEVLGRREIPVVKSIDPPALLCHNPANLNQETH